MYSSDNFHPSLILHKQKIVGEWPIMSLPVLIAQTESAIDNIYIIYETLCTPFSPSFSSLRQEAAIHSASLVYLHYVDPHTILYMCFPMCADERYCSPNVFYRLVPPLRTLKVTLSFPAKDTWA